MKTTRIVTSVLLAAIVVVAVSCRQKPPQDTDTTSDTADRVSTTDTSDRSTAGDARDVTNAGSQDKETATPDADTDSAAGGDNDAAITTVDDRDDPTYSRRLPRSDDLDAWAKTKAVIQVPADALDTRLGTVLDGYRIEWACAAEYTTDTAYGKMPVEVVLVKTDTVSDAFGMLTVMCSDRVSLSGDEGSCSVPSAGTAGAAEYRTKGAYFAMVRQKQADDGGASRGIQPQLADLADIVVFNVPGGGQAPALVDVFPDEPAPAKLAVIRRAKALGGPAVIDAFRDFANIGPDRFDDMLRMTGEPLAAVATYDVNGWDTPNIVLVVRYPDAAEAALAESKLKLYREPGNVNRLLFERYRQYIVATFTPEQESQMFMMQEILTRLQR